MDVKPKDEISEMETTSDLSSIGSSWLSSATDAKLLHLEQVALTREIDWLLRNEFPFICHELRKTITLCRRFISQSAQPAPAALPNTNITNIAVPSDDPQQSLSNFNFTELIQNKNDIEIDKELRKLADSKVIPFESLDKCLKGSVTIEGWHITAADLDISFPKWNKGVSFHTTITSSTPWRLTQLQNAYNFLNLALRELDRITLVPSPSPTPPSSTETSFNDIPQQHLKVAYRLIEQISTWIKNAQDQILLPSRTTFLNSLNTRFAFHPQLPKELVVEFGIANKELVISAYLLKAVPPPSKSKGATGPTTTTGQTKTTFFLRNENQHFQIIDQTQVECSLKKLDTIYALIQQAYEHCTEFEEKVVALSSMNTFFL
jgi:hypothetical protein